MIATCMAWLNDVKAGGGTAFIHPGRVSIQGVKSLWGDRFVFPRLGTGDTDRGRINKGLFTTCQSPWCPISEKRRDPPKLI